MAIETNSHLGIRRALYFAALAPYVCFTAIICAPSKDMSGVFEHCFLIFAACVAAFGIIVCLFEGLQQHNIVGPLVATSLGGALPIGFWLYAYFH